VGEKIRRWVVIAVPMCVFLFNNAKFEFHLQKNLPLRV